jgi:hypothetical protein
VVCAVMGSEVLPVEVSPVQLSPLVPETVHAVTFCEVHEMVEELPDFTRLGIALKVAAGFGTSLQRPPPQPQSQVLMTVSVQPSRSLEPWQYGAFMHWLLCTHCVPCST